ncbi:MAG: type III secretion protein [Planctomycetaceae bacterium]|nr:MAG: type III secretion protein [Planctomycetaceae bacterium]
MPIDPGHFLAFLLVATRIGGLVLVAPLFVCARTSWIARGLLTLAIALMIAPITEPSAVVGLLDEPWELLSAACREAVLGLMLGAAVVLLVAGLQAGGQWIGQMSGMSLAEAIDPSSGHASTGFGKLFELTGVAAFLLTGGHRRVLVALLDTFQWMPPGRVGFGDGLLTTLQQVVAGSFELALRVSAPVLVALLISALVLGAVNRLVPQIHTLSWGFPLNMTVAMAMIFLTLGGVTWIFQDHAEATLAAVYQAIQSGPDPLSGIAGGD